MEIGTQSDNQSVLFVPLFSFYDANFAEFSISLVVKGNAQFDSYTFFAVKTDSKPLRKSFKPSGSSGDDEHFITFVLRRVILFAASSTSCLWSSDKLSSLFQTEIGLASQILDDPSFSLRWAAKPSKVSSTAAICAVANSLEISMTCKTKFASATSSKVARKAATSCVGNF